MSFRNGTLTILSGQTESEVLDLRGSANGAFGLFIVSPTTLPETVNLIGARSLTGLFGMIQSGGADVLLAPGKATQMAFVTARALKLKATGAVAADRVFELSGNRFSA